MLSGVSFKVDAGEMVAIMGASGAGKSTLLHLLGGLESTDHGSIRFGEFQVTAASRSMLAGYRSKRVGFIFQFHHLLPDLTAAENVAFPLAISRAPWRESRLRALDALETLGLGDRVAHRIGDLSGGEQQRVALARAMITSPRLVLADEPTGNLDAAAGDEIGKLLASYCRQQRAVVVIATHNAHLAQACDRTLVLEDGGLREKKSSSPF
ncbi:MAG: lipoprotein-releasing system ATP-binding protein [Acidobacteriota bacterium]|nr:lipoprotein-releasing system ATP-binding protein [Acidobacteriota bacterium]